MITKEAQKAAEKFAEKMLAKGYKFEALHIYRGRNGIPIYYRIRLKHPNGEKWIRPMHQGANGQFYLGEPRARKGKLKILYGLDLLENYPNATVIIVEGEKSADALNAFFKRHFALDRYIAITSGSADSAELANWEELKLRKCIVWPDNDYPGENYAKNVCAKIAIQNCVIEVIDVSLLNLAEKEDCVDWLQNNSLASLADFENLHKLNEAQIESLLCDSEDNFNQDCIVSRKVSDIISKPINWLWPKYIAYGKLTMIAGDPGLGKSQITASIAGIVSTGQCWPLTNIPAENGVTILLSAEDDLADTIRPRLEAAGADLSKIYTLDAIRDFDSSGNSVEKSFNLQTDLLHLEEMIVKTRASVIIIDPITAYLGNTDSHRNADVRAALAPIASLAARHNVAFICVSHLNKSENQRAINRITGSIAFAAAARAAFIVAKDKENEGRRLFLPLKNNIGNDKTGFSFSIESYQLDGGIETSRIIWGDKAVTIPAEEAMSYSATGNNKSALEEAKEFLVEKLSDGPITTTQLLEEAKSRDISKITLRRARKALGIMPQKTGMEDGWVSQLPPKAINSVEDDHLK